MKNIFKLSLSQLRDISEDLTAKIATGLIYDNTEIKCIPTFIHPKKEEIKGNATVLDLGGTNFRAAVVAISETAKVLRWAEQNIIEMKSPGFTRNDLFRIQADTLKRVNAPGGPIGYCFSYPAKSLLNGDAELLTWTKGVQIQEMISAPVGRPLLQFLNEQDKNKYTGIKVLNDTITSLFAGLLFQNYDAYIGIIVGTGTNMATFYSSENIPKLEMIHNWKGETPVNLESGNFNPPHLTPYDKIVDEQTNNKGSQRFEKAISGMYLGTILKAVFPYENLKENLDASDLTHIINQPADYRENIVETAWNIYERSAMLVAASLAGLVKSLYTANPRIRKVQVLAEGSLFWSRITSGRSSYVDITNETLKEILHDPELPEINVRISHLENANLIGAAMAVLS